MLTEFLTLNNKKDFLIHDGARWKTYYYKNTYIKILIKPNKLDYSLLLHELRKEPLFQEYCCQILDIHKENENFFAYQITKEKGISIEKSLKKSQDPLYDFLVIAKQFCEILKLSKQSDIVLKDINTKGNMLYNPRTKQIKIIDIDGLQTKHYSDNLIHEHILYSDWFYTILDHPKYSLGENFTHEMNIFLFYELFFKIVFRKSLLRIPSNHLGYYFSKKYIQEKSFIKYARTKQENNLKTFLNYLNFPKQDQLYSKIIDLIHDSPNDLSYEDFEFLANHYKLDLEKKRLIR